MTEPARSVAAVNRRTRSAALLVSIVGVILVAGAVLADLRPSAGGSGFGLVQAAGLLVGALLLTFGVDLRAGHGDHWRRSIRTAMRSDLLRLLVIGFELLLVIMVARAFEIENPALTAQIIPLAAIAFILHHLTPQPRRLGLFVLVSLVGIVMVMGWTNAAWLVGLIVAIVALCHLPLKRMPVVAVLLGVGVLMGVLRMRPESLPFSPAIWPVLGSILMFRLIVYAYDVLHGDEKPSPTWAAAYFFMLPNVVFPLFPVVDYATFRRTYYDADAFDIYQRGVSWILRGLIHLILYRVVYQHLSLAPTDVQTGTQLVRYMVATFLLYLRVSGSFHLIVGMLHLFGFRLPATHRFFYLATSFSDLWRRINIYWKDFMMKVVFYPVYFPLRKRTGDAAALITATVAVFFVTWFTHAYQWFWILNRWVFSAPDAIFWGGLGILLVLNSLWEIKHGRRRTLPGAQRNRVKDAFRAGLKASAVFGIMCFLWALWSAPTLGDWLDLVRETHFGARGVAAAVGVLLLIGTVGFAANLFGIAEGDVDRGKAAKDESFGYSVLTTSVGLAALLLVIAAPVQHLLSPRAQEVMRTLRIPELNRQDRENLQRGYYEDLQNVGVQNSQLWQLYAKRPNEGKSIWKSGVLRQRADFMAFDMKPLFGIFLAGNTFTTNRWGMRDEDYQKQKPPHTYRIALLGQSYVAGDGVSDGQTFEQVVEDRFAHERPDTATKVQILNFAVGSYSLFQQLLMLNDRVFDFQPDVVLLVGNPGDGDRTTIQLVQQIDRGVEPPWPYVRDLVGRLGITAKLRQTEALRRLAPYRDSLVAWTEHQIVEACRAHHVRAIWAYLDVPERGPTPERINAMVAQARTAGFYVLDWSHVYDGHDLSTLQATPWDRHPNAEGHRLIAARLYHDISTDTAFALPDPSAGTHAVPTPDRKGPP